MCTNNMVLWWIWWTWAFLLRVLIFGTCQTERAYVISPQWKPWTFHMHCHYLLEELSTFFVTQPGEDSWKLAFNFLCTLPHLPFPCADLALYHFILMNLSCKYDHMLSSMSSSSESSNVELVLRTSNMQYFTW